MLTYFDKAWVAAVIAPLCLYLSTKFGIDSATVSGALTGIITAILVYIVPNKPAV